MATEDPSEIDVRQARFGGLNASLPPYNVPLGTWADAWNLTTYAREGYAITRNGYRPASKKIKDEPFAMLGGVEGGMVIVITGDPPAIDYEGDFVLGIKNVDASQIFYSTTDTNGYNPVGVFIELQGAFDFTAYGGTELGMDPSSYSWTVKIVWGSGDHKKTVSTTAPDEDATYRYTFTLPEDDEGGSYGTVIYSRTLGGYTKKVYYYGVATVTASNEDGNDTTRSTSLKFYLLYSPSSTNGGDGGGDDPEGTTEEDPPDDDTDDPVVDPDVDDPPTGDGTTGGEDDPPTTGGGAGPTPGEDDIPPITPGGDEPDTNEPTVNNTNRYKLIVDTPETVNNGGKFSFTVTAKDVKTGMLAAMPSAPTIVGYLPTDSMPDLILSSSYYTDAKYLIDMSNANAVFSNGNTVYTVNNAIFRLPDVPNEAYNIIQSVDAVITAAIEEDKQYIKGGTMLTVERPVPSLSVVVTAQDLTALNPKEYAGISSVSNYTASLQATITQTLSGGSTEFIPYDIIVYGTTPVGSEATITFGQCCPGSEWSEGDAVDLISVAGYDAIPLSVFQDGEGVAVVRYTVSWSATAVDPNAGIWPWMVNDHWTGVSTFAMLPEFLQQNTGDISDASFDITQQTKTSVAYAIYRQVLLGAQYGRTDIGEGYESVDTENFRHYICADGQSWDVNAILYDPDHAASDRLTGSFVGAEETAYAMTSGQINDTSSPMSTIPSGAYLTSATNDDDMATPKLGARSVPVYVYSNAVCETETYDLYRACVATDDIDAFDLYTICPE